MKRFFYGLVIILFACQNRDASQTENAVNINGPTKVLTIPYNAEFNEQTQKIELKRGSDSTAALSVAEMINALNLKYPDIKLRLLSTSSDTVHVAIDDASYLSETLGSAGAKVYLAEATFALTNISGIKAVDFAFEEGDHAAPGLYSRADFNILNL